VRGKGRGNFSTVDSLKDFLTTDIEDIPPQRIFTGLSAVAA